MALRREDIRSLDPYDGWLESLAWSLEGDVIRPGDAEYDRAREVYDREFDRRPSVIVRPVNAQDVAKAVTFARQHNVTLAIKSGGHSFAGHSSVEDGMLIDMSHMKSLHIDPERRIARAQPGLTWNEYAKEANHFGLATTSGDVGTVGLGGLTLGGGIGWMTRKYGLTIDHLVSAEVVTANGELIYASEDENQDLFWALRGGGGNFGIVTSMELRLEPVDIIVGGLVVYPIDDATAVLRAYADYAISAPDELTTMAYIMHAPPAPFIPPEVHGQPVVAIMLAYAGPVEDGMRVVAPLRSLGTRVAEMVAPMPYPTMFTLTEAGGVRGLCHADRSMFLSSLDDDALELIVRQTTSAPSPMAMTQIRALGGAMTRVPGDATAFSHRDKPYIVNIIDTWADPAEGESNRAWVREYFAALHPRASGVYVNFLGDEGDLRLREAYSAETYHRLQEIKLRYDPTNVFRLNQNIQPMA